MEFLLWEWVKAFFKVRTGVKAQIFCHFLLVFKYQLIENERNMKNYRLQLKNSENDSFPSYKASGRYFVTLLYNADTKKPFLL